ncbi:MAG: hypothetical protein ACOVRM_13700, partial [Planctomycetaceae bacterium]
MVQAQPVAVLVAVVLQGCRARRCLIRWRQLFLRGFAWGYRTSHRSLTAAYSLVVANCLTRQVCCGRTMFGQVPTVELRPCSGSRVLP